MSEIKDKYFEEISLGQEKAKLKKDLDDNKLIINCINIGKYISILNSNGAFSPFKTKDQVDKAFKFALDKIYSSKKYNLSKEDINSVLIKTQ